MRNARERVLYQSILPCAGMWLHAKNLNGAHRNCVAFQKSEAIMFKKLNLALVASAALSLVGCGGGGGSSAGATSPAVVSSTATFQLRSVANAFRASGFGTTNFTANGTTATANTDGNCTGSLSYTSGGASTATTFEGQPALSGTSVSTMSFTNCTPASITSTSFSYYDTSYVALGSVNQDGSNYCVVTSPTALPLTFRVGDTGVLPQELCFTSSSKATADGRLDRSYVVEADTADSAIVNIISKNYNSSNQLLFTGQERIRFYANSATPQRVSIDIQYVTTSTIHLVFRR
jgi:hypothetical protein